MHRYSLGSIEIGPHRKGDFVRIYRYSKKTKKGQYYCWKLTIPSRIVKALDIRPGDGADLSYDTDDMELTVEIVPRGGQRKFSLRYGRDGKGNPHACLHIGYLVTEFNLSPDSILGRDLPAEVSPESKTMWIDFSIPKKHIWEDKKSDATLKFKISGHGKKLQINSGIPSDFLEMLKVTADVENKSIAALAKAALLEYIENHYPEIYHDERWWI